MKLMGLQNLVLAKISVAKSLGVSLSGARGSVERSFLPINSSAGVLPFSSGVDLYESNANYGSSDLTIKSFAVLTTRSTSPLLCR